MENYLDEYINNKYNPEIKESVQLLEYKNICENCNDSSNLDKDETNGVLVCLKCGLVNENQIISNEPEWNWYGSEDSRKSSDPARCYMVNHLYKNSLTLIIGNGKTNFKNKYKTMLAQSLIAMDPTDKKLYNMIDGINGIKKLIRGQLPPKIIERTSVLCKKYNEILNEDGSHKVHRGGIRKGILSACIYYACQQENINKSIRDISQITGSEYLEVVKGIKILTEEVHIQVDSKDAVNFVELYGNNLGLSLNILELSKDIALYSQEYITDKTPQAIASGSIYYVLNRLDMLSNYLHNKKLENEFKITMVTIIKVYNLILSKENQILKNLG